MPVGDSGRAVIARSYHSERDNRLDRAAARADDDSPPFPDAAMDKTLSFAAVHFVVAFLVGYIMTGSVWVGGALALVEPACNTVAFHLHEKAWKRIERRRAASGPPRLAA